MVPVSMGQMKLIINRRGRDLTLSIHVKVVQEASELEQALDIRRQVFIEEQEVPEDIEVDEYEQTATHFLALDGTEPVGTCRLRWVDPQTAKAERVAVLKEKRSTGAGRKLMEALEAYARDKGAHSIVLNAQARVLSFYEKLGYVAMGTPFMDAGIEHRKMKKELV